MRTFEEVDALIRAKAERGSPVPNKYIPTFRRAFTGGNRRRDAIRAFCLECVGFSESGVLECTAISCPLNLYRKGPETAPVALGGPAEAHDLREEGNGQTERSDPLLRHRRSETEEVTP